MKPKELEKSKVDEAPYLVWNAFIEVVNGSQSELNDIQSVASLAFWYDSEIQNGGHLQYFENIYNNYKNREEAFIKATLEALKIIGANKQADILNEAAKLYFTKQREHPSSTEEFCELELQDEFGNIDGLYYKCAPDMNNYLEQYLHKYQGEFVTLV
jgi:hypothetical protein